MNFIHDSTTNFQGYFRTRCIKYISNIALDLNTMVVHQQISVKKDDQHASRHFINFTSF